MQEELNYKVLPISYKGHNTKMYSRGSNVCLDYFKQSTDSLKYPFMRENQLFLQKKKKSKRNIRLDFRNIHSNKHQENKMISL